MLGRVNALITDASRTLFKGIGKPEPLAGMLSGWCLPFSLRALKTCENAHKLGQFHRPDAPNMAPVNARVSKPRPGTSGQTALPQSGQK